MSKPEPTVVTPRTLREWPLPEPGDGKSARGALAVVGGTVATPGAVLLAGEASLRAGAGKLSLATPEAGAASLAVAVPEAMVVGLPASAGGSIAVGAAADVVSFAEGADAVLVGPGFMDPQESVRLLAAVAPSLSEPLVVDALASAYLTEHPKGLRHLDGRVVLTVNPVELARTAGRDESEVEKDPYDAAADDARSGERLASSVGAVGYLARELPPEVPPVLAELA